MTLRAPTVAAVLLLVLPTVLVAPPVAASDPIEVGHHYLGLDRPLVLPGDAVTVSLNGNPGMVTLTLHRLLDPVNATRLDDPTRVGALRLLSSENVTMPDTSYGWGALNVPLSLPEAGLYLVTAARDGVEQRAYVQATSFSFVTKTGPSSGLVYAFSVVDGMPIAGASVHAGAVLLGTTGADGLLTVEPDDLRGAVMLTLPNGTVSAGDLTYSGSWYRETSKVLTYFDRPLYRPGQTVHYKTLSLVKEGDRFVPATNGSVRVTVTSYARGIREVVHEANHSLTSFGSAAGSFVLREDANLGAYSVETVTSKGAQGWSSFDVEAYRKPRVKVDAAPARDVYVQGEPAVIRATAEWYFGAPLTRGLVTYEIFEETTWLPWGGCRFCADASFISSYTSAYSGSSTLVSRGSGTLTDAGAYLLTYTPPKRETPTTYLARFHVTAESGEQQTAETRFRVLPSEHVISVAMERYAVNASTPLNATVTVTDRDGTPRADVDVTVTLREERGDARSVLTTLTDTKGRASVSFDERLRAGSYVLLAESRDAEGRLARAEAWAWVADTTWGHLAPENGLQLIPERETYAPGEVARVLVVPTRPMHVLLTMEGADLSDARVLHVERPTFVEVPIQQAHAPDVSFSAFAATGVGPYGPEIQTAMLALHVTPDPRGLTVDLLTDKPSYRDGERARILLQVRDAEGHPVVGEFSLGMVDASLYALRPDATPKLLSWAYPSIRNVQTTFAWQTLGVRYPYAPIPEHDVPGGASPGRMVPPGGWTGAPQEGAGAGMVAVPVREDFPDTALWLPTLTTDEKGTARVELTAPDTLTEWTITARGLTRTGQFGEATDTIHTRKPLSAELAAPRFLVDGDHLNLTAIVWNDLGGLRDIEVQILAGGSAVLGDAGYRVVTLSHGDSARLDFPLTATLDPSGLANLTLLVRSEGEPAESDGYRVHVPVLPHGILQKATRAGTGPSEFRVPVPPGPFAKAPVLEVTLAPNMATTALDALPYLVGYPYGCVEQTMSRFMPAVVATRALEEAGYTGVEDERVPEYVDAGLKRLLAFQHVDGGWGWWENDVTHPYMTAYTVAGLAEAKRAGAPVDADMMVRGLRALENLYVGEKNADLAAYMAYALALAGAPPKTWPARDQVGLDGLALLGLARLAAGDREEAASVADALIESATREEGRLYWSGDAAHWGLHGIRSDVQLTAHALRLLVGLDRDDEAAQVVPWLAERRQGHHWDTTKDTTESILAIVEYVTATGELNPDLTATLTVNGETREARFQGDAKALAPERFTFPIPESLAGAEVPVHLTTSGTGRLYWTAVITSVPHAESIPADGNGIQVVKRILDSRGFPTRVLSFNERYTIQIQVMSASERSYVLLKDALPAGVEVVDPNARDSAVPAPTGIIGALFGRCVGCGYSHWGYPWTNLEVRDDHVAAFATTIPAGETLLSYQVRAVHPGSYHVLPATVEAMYAPAVWGRSADTHLTITEPPALLFSTALLTERAVNVRLVPDGALTLAPGELMASLLDANGTDIPLAAPPTVTPLSDGTLNVTIHAAGTLPDSVTVAIVTDQVAVTRVVDRREQPVTYGSRFTPQEERVWGAGPAVTGARADPREEPAVDAARFERPSDAPFPVAWPFLVPEEPEPKQQGKPDPVAGPESENETPSPAAIAVGVALAVAAALLGAGRRKRR